MIGIKDMYMPERCIICPFYMGLHDGICLISEISHKYDTMDMPEYYRQDWCPLVEIEKLFHICEAWHKPISVCG